jgi:hypothetical protein
MEQKIKNIGENLYQFLIILTRILLEVLKSCYTSTSYAQWINIVEM